MESENTQRVAECFYEGEPNGEGWIEANKYAQLFAAAPDLLEALTDLLAWANIQDHHSPQAVAIRDAARDAIAVAKGVN